MWGESGVFSCQHSVCFLSNLFHFFPGRVIVATSKGVYILVPLPLEKQIQDLLASHRVEEALVLAKGARRNIPKEKFQVCSQLAMWKRASKLLIRKCSDLRAPGPADHFVSVTQILCASTSYR